MTDSDFDIFLSRELFLTPGEESPEIVIEDKDNSNLFLTFKLDYIPDKVPGRTYWTSSDEQHALFTIETRPNSVTKPSKLIELGTFEDGTPIFLGFLVRGKIPQTGQHEVNITLYKPKQSDGISKG